MRVSKNSYYNWFTKKDSVILQSPKILLKQRIRIIFDNRKEIYGSYPIHKQLEQEGLYYSRSYIGRLMNQMGIKSVLRK